MDGQSIESSVSLRRRSKTCMDRFRGLLFFVRLFQSLGWLRGQNDGVLEHRLDRGRYVVLYRAINRGLRIISTQKKTLKENVQSTERCSSRM